MKIKTLVSVIVALSGSVSAADSEWQGAVSGNTNDSNHAWFESANWNNSNPPAAAGDVATFPNNLTGNLTVYLAGADITLKKLAIQSTAHELNLNGGGGALTFASGDATVPEIVSSNTAGTTGSDVTTLLYLPINGSQGLTMIGGNEWCAFRFNASTDWSGFSGDLTVAGGFLAPQAGNNGSNTVLPGDERIILGTAGVTNFELSSGRDQTIASLSGTANAYIFNNTQNSANWARLTLGDATTDADFGGTLGMRSDGGRTGTTDYVLHLNKRNGGTQTLSGPILGSGSVTVNTDGGTLVLSGQNTYAGTTTVNSGGTLLVNGSHDQGSGLNGGRIVVSSGGTLGGAGSIHPSDASGSLTCISVSGVLAPGKPEVNGGIGSITLDGSDAARPLLAMESGASMSVKLGPGYAASRVSIASGQSNDVSFDNNTIDFTDTTGGVLYAGQYLVFQGDVGTGYSGLTTDANGVITSGLSIGGGLAAYSGSQLKLSGSNIFLILSSPYSPPAAALDSFRFGDLVEETIHALDATGTVLDNAGGLGQTCRHLVVDTFLDFELAVNPSARNYLTLKLWGDDTSNKTIHLYKAGTTTSLPASNHYGVDSYVSSYPDIMAPIYLNRYGEKPFPGRFYYVTLLIPDEIIDIGTSTASIRLGVETSSAGQSAGIYAAYSGTDPFFDPGEGEAQGVAPEALTPSAPPSVPTVISNLKSDLNAAFDTVAAWQIHGSSWNGVTTSIDGTGGTAAYSPVGAFYKNANPSSPPTLTQIQMQMSGGNGVNMRIPSYMAMAYVLPWSNHYHDPVWLDRVVKALDFCCIMQASNGGLSTYNGNSNYWVGAPDRVPGGNPLEGFGVQGIGLAFNTIFAEAQADPAVDTLLQGYLDATITDGINNLTRREAWRNLMNNNVQFLISGMGRGHATNQDLAQITAMWLQNQAAVNLGSTTSLSTQDALDFVYSATGLAATPLSADPALAGKWFSPNALPMEPWGTLGGGYDGNYGLDNCVTALVYLAELTGDAAVREQATNAITSSAAFLFPSTDNAGFSSWRKEEVISTRTQNWPGRVSFFGDGLPFAASPHGLDHPLARRFTQLSYQLNDTMTLLPSNNAHYVDSVGYALLNLGSYESALLAPATTARAPMETGQPDFAFADPVGCTVAAQKTLPAGGFNRLYMELQWRRAFSPASPRDLTTANVNDIARIHFTTPSIDRVATVAMQSTGGFGGLYSCHYGPFFVAMNLNETTPAGCTLPPELWGKVGKNMVTQSPFIVPADGVIQVYYTDPLVFTESEEPVVTSAAEATLAGSGLGGDLNVEAADNGGAENLTYTWSTAGTPPAPVSFSPNGTNAAANTTATFSKAGVYQILVTITNGGGSSSTSSVEVIVDPQLAQILVDPDFAALEFGETLDLAAAGEDQFGDALAVQPAFAWSVASGSGTIDPDTGSYTAPTTGGSVVIHATSGATVGVSNLTVVTPPFSDVEYEAPQVSADGNSVTLTTKTSIVGHVYRVQTRVDLATGEWLDAENAAPQEGTGGSLVFLIERNPNEPRRFYRIAIVR